MESIIVDNAKVMAKGQITLPKDIRAKLGVDTGDRVTFICDGSQVIMVNAAVYAMNVLRREMQGEATNAGIENEDDIAALVADVRSEIEGL